MIVIYNRLMPLQGFSAMNICGIILAKEGTLLDEEILRHESIHTRQQLEMLIIPFFIAYLIEWLIRLILVHSFKKAYCRISFEQEAYQNQGEKDYLKTRKAFSWIRYI